MKYLIYNPFSSKSYIFCKMFKIILFWRRN